MPHILQDRETTAQTPKTLGLPFEQLELELLLRTLRGEKEKMKIFWDSSEKLKEYEDKKDHPAYSEFYKGLVLEKQLWDAYIKQVDPLIKKIEQALSYVTR